MLRTKAPELRNVQSLLRAKKGDVEKAFNESDKVFEQTFQTQMVHQGYIEPYACLLGDRRRGMLVEDGRVTSLSLGDYKIPTIRDLPTRKTTLVAGAIEGPGPFNAKPAAAHAITPIPPAIGNAVFNATGVRLTSLPISCGKVYQAKK